MFMGLSVYYGLKKSTINEGAEPLRPGILLEDPPPSGGTAGLAGVMCNDRKAYFKRRAPPSAFSTYFFLRTNSSAS